ncbi:GspH/FimT family pseudopilin [Uliginosibacterium paludis]
MVTLAVAAILAGIAAPSMSSLIRQNRITSVTNDLVSAAMYARSEAILRGAQVVLCSTTDTSASSPTCAATDSWAGGWIVYIDTDGNGSKGVSETVLRVWPGPQAGITLTPSAANARAMAFSRTGGALGIDGAGTTTAGATFSICGGSSVQGRITSFNATGRATTQRISAC